MKNKERTRNSIMLEEESSLEDPFGVFHGTLLLISPLLAIGLWAQYNDIQYVRAIQERSSPIYKSLGNGGAMQEWYHCLNPTLTAIN